MRLETKHKFTSYRFLLLVLMSAFLLTFYGKVIFHPDSYMFADSGDGIKNYYTYAYFISNNGNATNFEGMNYPYGENFMYTDCHPLLASILRFLHSYFPWIAGHSIGILNFLLIFQLLICAFIMYQIFQELKVEPLLSALGAFGITVLNPQVFRLTGHYALSYSFCIPLVIYFLIIYEKERKQKIILLILFISILFFFFTHAYLGMMTALLVMVYAVISFFSEYVYYHKFLWTKRVYLLLSAVMPVILFYLFVKLTDTHVGRTTNPWGILECHADASTVFLPVMHPLNKIKDFFIPRLRQPWEGWAYIGFSTIIALVVYGIATLKLSLRSRKPVIDKTWLDQFSLRMLFISSLLVLAFSLFLPFRLHLEELINYFNFIKQFRAIGRFAWVFYYVSAILMIYMANRAYMNMRLQKRTAATLIIILVPLSLVYEGIYYHKNTGHDISRSANLFDLQQTTAQFREDIRSIHPDRYQAMVAFPFFYIGSENFGKPANNEIYRLSQLFSYHLHLPMFNSYLSRTSIKESKNIMQMMAGNFYRKEISQDIHSNKPFLVISLNDNLDEKEMNYLHQGTCLIRREQYSIYEINPQVFFENTSKEEISKFFSEKQLYPERGFLVSDTSLYFSYTDFKKPGLPSFQRNNGCYSGRQRDFNVIYTIDHRKLKLNRKYMARFWMYNKGENFGQDCLNGMIFFQKKKDGQTEWLGPIVNAGMSTEINGDWSMVECSFVHSDANADYDLVFKGDDLSHKIIYVDDLLIYDSELMVYQYQKNAREETLFRNNEELSCTTSTRNNFYQ